MTIVGAGEDAGSTGLARWAVRVSPRRDAPTDELVLVLSLQIDAGIEAPELGSREWIKRDDVVEGRAKDETSVDENRGGLESSRRWDSVLPVGLVPRPVRPRDLELSDVVRRDLAQGNIALPARVVPVARPFARRAPFRFSSDESAPKRAPSVQHDDERQERWPQSSHGPLLELAIVSMDNGRSTTCLFHSASAAG